MTSKTYFGLRLDTRSNRRIVVASTYASYFVLCISSGLAHNGSWLWIAIAVALIGIAGVTLGVGWFALTDLVREYGFPGDSRLFASRDERQTGVRHRAFVRAYGILTAVLCAGSVCWTIAPNLGLWTITIEYRNQIFFGLIFFATTLPSAVIAWTEPDPIPFEQV
jgi:hypothetical protein